MSAAPAPEQVAVLREAALPLGPSAGSLDPLLDRIGGAHVVLLGEATHGTHEFYRLRAEITKRLVREKGFRAVAIEGDWPDAARVNRYIRGADPGITDAEDALRDFRRFPQWMWRNADVLDLIGWLRHHNEGEGRHDLKVGWYGLDLYSLHASIDAVIGYLRRVDPEAARRALEHYACFDPFGPEPQWYGRATAGGRWDDCQDEVIAELVALRRAAVRYTGDDEQVNADDQFDAEQNARVVVNAERYYREMFGRRDSTWNLRDSHMAETLDEVLRFLGHRAANPRVVVWAHNSHVGDARATERGRAGELTLGQLVRERHGDRAILVGFTTSTGSVTAARNWDEPAERRGVLPPIPESWEALFQATRLPAFLVIPDSGTDAVLGATRLQRAIGVIYRPETERQSHYYHTRLNAQFDAVVHLDRTRAVEPLERTGAWDATEAPETWPSAL